MEEDFVHISSSYVGSTSKSGMWHTNPTEDILVIM